MKVEVKAVEEPEEDKDLYSPRVELTFSAEGHEGEQEEGEAGERVRVARDTTKQVRGVSVYVW